MPPTRSLFADLAAACSAVTAGRPPPGLPPTTTKTPLRTRPFLTLTSSLLPVLTALGRGLGPARADIEKNLARLVAAADGAHPRGALDADVRLIAAGELEGVDGDADALHGSTSAAKALLWLGRTLAWVAGVLRGVAGSEGEGKAPSLGAVAREAYGATLRPFHGPVTGAAVSGALAFAPGRSAFWRALGVTRGETAAAAAAAEALAFCDRFDPIVKELQAYMAAAGLDDPAPVR